MFRERNEWPSTAGEAEERSGYMELYAVAGGKPLYKRKCEVNPWRSMEAILWISYDLHSAGDYEGLYSWLDNHEAIECGFSVARLKYEFESDIKSELLRDLKENVNFDLKKDRLYIVFTYTEAGKKIINSKFILGKRKVAPWEGYATALADEEQDESW